MPRKNPHRPFSADPRQIARQPEISGNTINGLGENAFRRPQPVYWSVDMDAIAHGGMQAYFYERSAEVPEFATLREKRVAIASQPLSDLSPDPASRSPQEWTDSLEQFVTAGYCERVGVTPMRLEWAYADEEIAWQQIIMIAVQHDYDAISTAPQVTAGLEVMTQYTRAAAAAMKIASWLRELGHDAEPVTGPMTSKLTMIPPAIEGGFGELGKHGSLINPEFGSSFRLSAVLTDAPFAPTPHREFGVDEFCTACRICEDACPPEAISPDKQTVRGTEKWYVDFDKCLPFFNETHGCAICIAVCPWSRPGVGLNLAEKLARRSERQTNSSSDD